MIHLQDYIDTQYFEEKILIIVYYYLKKAYKIMIIDSTDLISICIYFNYSLLWLILFNTSFL